LVTTMIIESGLDMPNVNTILIDRADRLGLSQLHQLRGRVGCSRHQAYAFLMVPPDQTLTREARARLAAIQEFTDLGSGYHVAMRDLEIRGAGIEYSSIALSRFCATSLTVRSSGSSR
ncbi:MAG: helicase-related protein, partial [Phycisphaerales bacterium]